MKSEQFNLSEHMRNNAIGTGYVKEFIRLLKENIEKLHDEQRENQGETNNPEVAIERLNKAVLIFGNNGILEEIDKLAGDKLI